MRRDRGYLQLGRVNGVALRLHWTLPVGLFFLGGVGFNPVGWGSLLVILLVHEGGHAVLASAFGLAPRSIELHGAGGRCTYEGPPSDVARSAIAWGGVLAQAILFVVARRVGELVGPSGSPAFELAIGLLTGWNLVIAGLNLLPIPALDGGQAWLLFRWRNIAAVGRRIRPHFARRHRAKLTLKASLIQQELERLARRD